VYYREQDEIAFLQQLDLLGEDLLDTLPEYPFWQEIAPEPHVPLPARNRGKGFGVPEGQRKRICMDLTEQQEEVYYEGESWPRAWRWGAEFVAIPNNGWVEVIEIN
jgi:hypothetical protein